MASTQCHLPDKFTASHIFKKIITNKWASHPVTRPYEQTANKSPERGFKMVAGQDLKLDFGL